jgi:hypothetical protein
MNSIIDNQLDNPTRPQPIILTKEEREKAMQKCKYIGGLPRWVALLIMDNKDLVKKIINEKKHSLHRCVV